MIPERAGGSKDSKETQDTAEVESNGCRSGTGIRACIDKWCLQAGKTETSIRMLKVCCQQSVKADSDWWLTSGLMVIPNELKACDRVDQAGESRERHYTCMPWKDEIAHEQC